MTSIMSCAALSWRATNFCGEWEVCHESELPQALLGHFQSAHHGAGLVTGFLKFFGRV